MSNAEIFGAMASIRIRYDGTLSQLAEKLASALILSSFRIEPSEYAPHEEIGSTETLGWEVWLQANPSEGPGWYQLQMQTEDCFEEIFHGKMHDLSPWLARQVAVLCKVDTVPVKQCGSGGEPNSPGTV